jgi:hypothetical protein
MRISWVVFTGLGAVACGCARPDSTLEPGAQSIVAGALDPGDPAIMELLGFKGATGSRCTATLITPRLLLAAAHCLTETPGFERWVFPGKDDRNVADKDLLRLTAFVSDPKYGNPRQGHDFSIIVLEAPLAIRPLPINRGPIDKALGKAVRYVGYGLTTVGDPNSGGLKRQNTAPLAQVGPILLGVAPNPHGSCNGDSGGPLLLQMDDGLGESIAGIASFVDAPACLRDSYYQRVDTQLAWIDEQIQKYDPGGLAPPGDGGAADAAPAGTPDAGAPDLGTPPPPPDARLADALAPSPEPSRDVRGPDVARALPVEPEPEVTTPTGGSGGGCTYVGRAGANRLGALLLALAWAAGRSRRRARGLTAANRSAGPRRP